MKDLKRFVRVAQGLEPAELVLKHGRVFQTFMGQFVHGDIAVQDGYVAGVGTYTGKSEIDLAGRFVTPGFIDGHVHIESSMLSPLEFARAVLPAGTTTVVADPHEIANVAGIKGIQYMMQASENIPLDVYFMLSSCVPATSLEDAGAVLTAKDLAPLMPDRRVLGLAELMNVPGVLCGDDEVYAKLAITGGKRVDGHAPGLSGLALMGYAAAGVSSDHECVTIEDARERLGAGMFLMLREGSAAHNLSALLPAVTAENAQFCCFVTDDRHPADLLSEGHINHMVRIAVAEGVPVARALQMATINTARYFGLKELGVIAPHYKADLLVFDDLREWKPCRVFKEGRAIAENGKALFSGEGLASESMEHTVHVANLCEADLHVPVPTGQANVIGLVPYQIVTKKLQLKVRTENGGAVSQPEQDILKAAVFERHHATGLVGTGLVQGFGLQKGALASTVAHDSHNLITIGVSDADMLCAAQELRRIGGGIAVALDGRVLGSLALPIAGLMSKLGAAEVAAEVARLVELAHGLGVRDCYDPFLTLAFLSLPVIPELKLTDRGLVDVAAFRFITVSADDRNDAE
jgi:adenine deaminase